MQALAVLLLLLVAAAPELGAALGSGEQHPLPFHDLRGERVLEEWLPPPVKGTGAPTVLQSSPRGATAEGNITIMLSGESFRDYGDVKCRVCSVEVRGYVFHQGAITCQVPPVSALPKRMAGEEIELPAACTVDVTLNGVDYSGNSEAVFWYYNLSAVSIATMHPSGGPDNGGTVVLLEGTNFVDYGGGVQGPKCRFGSSVVPATLLSHRTARCISPPLPVSHHAYDPLPAAVPVYLTLNGYTDERSLSGPMPFRYTKPPVVSDLHPHGGPAAGGQRIIVRGTGFIDDSITRRSCETGGAMAYLCELHRIAAGVNRTDQPIPGVLCVFEAKGDTSRTAVLTTPALLHGGDGTELGCEVPKQAAEKLASQMGPWCAHYGNSRYCNDTAYVESDVRAVLVRITLNGNVSDASPSALTYMLLPETMPRLFYVEPWGGPAAGGTKVRIVGEQLLALGVTPVCRFGNIEVPALVGGVNGSLALDNAPLETPMKWHDDRVTRVVATQTGRLVECESPPGHQFGSRWARVGVSLDGEHFASDTLAFRYTQFSVSGVYPMGSPLAGGTRILLSGLGLTDFGGLRCVFGEQEVAATLFDARGVWCDTPPSPSGLNGSVPLSLSLNGQLRSAALEHGNVTFSYFDDAAVIISSAQPALGPVLGGVSVTVRGSGFAVYGAVQCRFGGTAPVNATYAAEFNTSYADAVELGTAATLPGSKALGPAGRGLDELICHLPPFELVSPDPIGSQLVTLEVSLNGAQFAPVGLPFLYHHPCYRSKNFALDYPSAEAQKAVAHYLNLNWPNLTAFDADSDGGLNTDEIRAAIEFLAYNASTQAYQHLPNSATVDAYQANTCFLPEQAGDRQLSRADDTTASDETGGFVAGGPTFIKLSSQG